MASEYTIRKPVLAYSTSNPGVRCSFVVTHLSRVEQSAGAFSSTLYLTFIGGARVHWTETRTERRHGQQGSRSINVTENYTSEEIYFNNSVYVIPKGSKAAYGQCEAERFARLATHVRCAHLRSSISGMDRERRTSRAVRSALSVRGFKRNAETVLPAGDHSFLFTFSIPSNLPSSFEGSFGYIRYTIKATLDRPWKFNQDTKVALTVLAYRDLNMYPQLRTPLILGNTKTICCWCCQSAPMAITARVPFTGVVPGQDVPLIVELDNPTSVDITSVQCYLMQVTPSLQSLLHWIDPRAKLLLDAGNTITAKVFFTGVFPGQDVPLIVELDNPTNVDITFVQCYLMQVTSSLPESPSLE
ncbi:unnamed protein product [Timema podura]|uniref:Arrestin-like N-terminal domain-containing protein n=1 Tax=Timema podura TaxID=61482 RepID=A0ABN7NUT3_TIMPD|nr:unnamed protein product [Timema podura]